MAGEKEAVHLSRRVVQEKLHGRGNEFRGGEEKEIFQSSFFRRHDGRSNGRGRSLKTHR